MFTKTIMASLALTAVLYATPALANRECMNNLKARADRIGLVTDINNQEIIVFSADRQKIAPLFAFMTGCLTKAYQKKTRTKLGGQPGTIYASDGGGSCQLPDLDRMGGRSAHRSDYAIWVNCK